MTRFNFRKRGSGMALAIALATGSTVVASAVFPAEAYAQKKKKKDEAAGAYSEAFVAAYKPIDDALKVEGADATPYKAQLEALVPLSVSADEKYAAGGLIYNTAIKLNDQALQLKGMELMISSGKIPLDSVGRYNFIGYQLSNAQKDFTKARTFLQNAINANFTTDTISSADLQIALAESYFAGNQFADGLNYLDQAIKSKKARGEKIDEAWYRRGLTVAYQNKIVPQVYDFAGMWIGDFPSPTNWRDVVNLTRNLNQLDPQQTLDLLRLSRTAGALQDKQDYILYVEAADARRLPKEVKDVIEQAYAKNAVSRDDIFIADSLSTANGRISTDRADLPSLERDAGAAGAQARTVMAAANAFYSYGEYAKAAKFFEKAVGLPGVDTGEALTRLGMAQVALGDYAAARTTLAKVQGQRAAVARLWSAYAAEKAGPQAAGASLGDLMSASK